MNAKLSLLQQFHNGTLAGKGIDGICKTLNIPYREKTRLLPLLNELIKEGELFQTPDGSYGTPEQLRLVKGVLRGNERGFAFLIPENKDVFPDDIFIPHRSLHGAMHGDTVFAKKKFFNGQSEGEIVAILERGFKEIVGVFKRDRRAGYLIPDDKRYFSEIYIPISECSHIKSGVKAVAKITEYPYGKSPGGKIVEILGDDDDFFAEELSIIRSFSLREEFPQAVEKAAVFAEKKGITQADIENRRDFRDELIVTVDGADTRDIDDAISVKKVGDKYLLGVHIADVSHYVPYRSTLDKEAFERGTSVYFPDRVLPMLPRALSNGICSLNENEERLTLSCLMTIDKKGKVIDSEIVEGVIRSNYKMTYDEVTQILENDEKTCHKYAMVADMVGAFAELTKILQTAREKKGSVDLEVKEAKILFDGENISVPDHEPGKEFSHQIIEQFMVLANETVAQYMQSIEAPFVYRIHEKPSEEKANAFRIFAQNLGITAKFKDKDVNPYDYQKILNSAKDLTVYPTLNRVMLRSMQKARYSSENLGHFGLASDCYCHFTSPIRRYPDLCIHRIIKDVLNGNYGHACDIYGVFVDEAATKSSEKERRAAEAEREVDALYATMYMSERIDEEYEAVISGVTSFGLFAELPNAIEGFIPIESLYGQFEFIPERFLLKGNYESYSLGEKIRISVSDVDFEKRRTIFKFLGKLIPEN
ncbi:MAG: ribonuclease R [Clostridia bacterium]|nr:ribonuclease R [Clostridia bacterium]